jgi:hypothetical protein
VTHAQVKKLVVLSGFATLAALGLMVLSILSPKPIYLVVAMSVGQAIGTISLALYLLAIVLDLQQVARGGADAEDADETRQESADEPKPAP